MGHRQKGKGHKRKRSWHRGKNMDWRYLSIAKKLRKAGLGI